MPTKISPMTNYYIRKLYRQKDPYLSQVEDMGDDFSTVLNLEHVLKNLYGKGNELDLMIRQLETLVQYHQGLTAQSVTPPAQLQEVEQRIFAILGESQIPSPSVSVPFSTQETQTPASPPEQTITIEQFLQILQQLQTTSITYLGAAITSNYLQASCPKHDWCQQFDVQRSQIIYADNPSQSMDVHQIELAQQWVNQFIHRCSQVITLFPSIVDQPQLLRQLQPMANPATT